MYTRNLDAINALRTAFMPPSLGVMEVAVEEFKVHHNLVFHHCIRMAEYESRLAYVVANLDSTCGEGDGGVRSWRCLGRGDGVLVLVISFPFDVHGSDSAVY